MEQNKKNPTEQIMEQLETAFHSASHAYDCAYKAHKAASVAYENAFYHHSMESDTYLYAKRAHDAASLSYKSARVSKASARDALLDYREGASK